MTIRELLYKFDKTSVERDELTTLPSYSDKSVMDHFRDTIGIQLSSLGDDTINLILMGENRDISEISPMYKNLTSWIVEASKSLASRLNIEYLREQSHAAYYVDYKCFNEESYGKYRRFIAVCKPVAHVGKTWVFAEKLSRISPLVDELALIFQTYNLNLIPRLDILIDMMRKYQIPRYDFFISEVDYVPLYNVAGWKRANKPKGLSKFHIRIKSLFHAMEIAGREANWYVENVLRNSNISGDKLLLDGLGVGWTKANMDDYNAISSFEASRLARYLEALRKNELSRAAAINAEVQEMDTDFFVILNNVRDSDEKDVLESDDITMFYHSEPIRHNVKGDERSYD